MFYPRSKLLLLILAFVLLLSSFQTAAAAEDETLYLAIGDSITEGTGMTSEEDIFVSQLSSQLKDTKNNLVTYNLGKKGYTVSDTIKCIQTPENEKLLKQADYITITAGGNDVLSLAAEAAKAITSKDYSKAKKIPKVMKSETTAKLMLSYMNTDEIQSKISDFTTTFANKLHSLLNAIKEKNNHGTIMIQTVYNPASGSEYTSLSECVDTVIVKINAIIKEEVSEREDENIKLLDTYTLFKNQSDNYVRINEDDIHPTKEGHTLIAKGLYDLITTGSVNYQALTKTDNETSDVISDAAQATNSQNDANNEETEEAKAEQGRVRFLTWAGLSFVAGLIFYLLFKTRKNMV